MESSLVGSILLTGTPSLARIRRILLRASAWLGIRSRKGKLLSVQATEYFLILWLLGSLKTTSSTTRHSLAAPSLAVECFFPTSVRWGQPPVRSRRPSGRQIRNGVLPTPSSGTST